MFQKLIKRLEIIFIYIIQSYQCHQYGQERTHKYKQKSEEQNLELLNIISLINLTKDQIEK